MDYQQARSEAHHKGSKKIVKGKYQINFTVGVVTTLEILSRDYSTKKLENS